MLQVRVELMPALRAAVARVLERLTGRGSVVQLSCPTVWASTNMKSQWSSVLNEVQNESVPPPAGTVTVRVRRL